MWVPAQYRSDVAVSSAKYGIRPELLAAVLKIESNFVPTAQSGAGAQGIAQFEPGTAAAYGVNVWDPASAIDGSAHLLSDLERQFGSETLALAAYNGGPGAISGGQASGQTAQYAATVLAQANSGGGTVDATLTGAQGYTIKVSPSEWAALKKSWKGSAAGWAKFMKDSNNNGHWALDANKAVDRTAYGFTGTQAELNQIVQAVVTDSANAAPVKNPVQDALNSVGNLVAVFGKIIAFFQNGPLWTRIGLGILGVIIVGGGAYWAANGLDGGSGGGKTKIVPLPV